MKELSLNILDIAKNSVKADSTLIEITVDENINKNLLTITIRDNGCGMSKEFLNRVKDPFTTTRTTRKVGMGIPLFELAANQAGGKLDIESELGKGTCVTATFVYDSIDRAPVGDITGTMITLISGSPKIDFKYIHRVNNAEFVFDTKEVKAILGDVPLNSTDVLSWIMDYITEGLAEIRGQNPVF